MAHRAGSGLTRAHPAQTHPLGARDARVSQRRSVPGIQPGRRAAGTLPAAMLAWSRRLLPLLAVALCAVTTAAAVARTPHGGPLTGTWSGQITGGSQRQRIVIVVNTRETGGSWKLGPSCYGPLRLDSISNGYHHYVRKRGRGATCAGGDIDCLRRAGANLYDAVTARRGGAYDVSGTLRRVRRT